MEFSSLNFETCVRRETALKYSLHTLGTQRTADANSVFPTFSCLQTSGSLKCLVFPPLQIFVF